MNVSDRASLRDRPSSQAFRCDATPYLIVAPYHEVLFQPHGEDDAGVRSLIVSHQLELGVELREAVLHKKEQQVQTPHRGLIGGRRELRAVVNVVRF